MSVVTTYFVESGLGEALSDRTDEATARNMARTVRERLCRREEEEGTLLGDSLVFDYGVGSGSGPDDRGEERCDECELWTVELVSSEHSLSCSLNPRNTVG
jgi:hypothetical protein